MARRGELHQNSKLIELATKSEDTERERLRVPLDRAYPKKANNLTSAWLEARPVSDRTAQIMHPDHPETLPENLPPINRCARRTMGAAMGALQHNLRRH